MTEDAGTGGCRDIHRSTKILASRTDQYPNGPHRLDGCPNRVPKQAVPATDLPVQAAGGALSLGGNIAEWTESHTKGEQVLRGGSWLLPQAFFQRLALRRLGQPSAAALDAGFRCAKSADSWPGASAD